MRKEYEKKKLIAIVLAVAMIVQGTSYNTWAAELFIGRRENSKSLAWSSSRLAFQNAGAGKVYQRSKAVGDIRGISYSYSLLWRFGVTRAPEAVEKKLKSAIWFVLYHPNWDNIVITIYS